MKANYPTVQCIFTSHNTELISKQTIRPDCCCLLSSKGIILPLDQAADRESTDR